MNHAMTDSVEIPTEEEAQRFLDYLASRETSWKKCIEALQEERHTTALNTMLTLAGWTLESGTHMEIPILPEFQQDFKPAGSTAVCPGCGNEYVLDYPGRPYCSNECADTHRKHLAQVEDLMHTSHAKMKDDLTEKEGFVSRVAEETSSFKARKLK